MFYIPCEQTAEHNGCSGTRSISGDKTHTSELQEKLTGALIGLARATEGNEHMLSDSTAAVTVEGLLAALPNGNADNAALLALLDRADAEKRKLVPECYKCASSCGRTENYDMKRLWNSDKDVRSIKTLILCGIRSIAAFADRTSALGCSDDSLHSFLYKGLFAIGMDDWGMDELLPIALEAGEILLKCTAMPGEA